MHKLAVYRKFLISFVRSSGFSEFVTFLDGIFSTSHVNDRSYIIISNYIKRLPVSITF